MHGEVRGAEGDGIVSQGPTPVKENADGEFSSVGALADEQVNQEVNVSATVSGHAEDNISSEVFMSCPTPLMKVHAFSTESGGKGLPC